MGESIAKIGPPAFDVSPSLEPEVEEKVPVAQETVWKEDKGLDSRFEKLATL